MPEVDNGDDPRPITPFADPEPAPPIELGGPVQDRALTDNGRLVIERQKITLEGPTPAIVMGIGAAGTVFAAVIALQPGGQIAGLAAIAAILTQNLSYFRFRRQSGLVAAPRRRNRKRSSR